VCAVAATVTSRLASRDFSTRHSWTVTFGTLLCRDLSSLLYYNVFVLTYTWWTEWPNQIDTNNWEWGYRLLAMTPTVSSQQFFLWSPYVIGQTIIFLPRDFNLLSSSFFIPRLISAAAGWMSTILFAAPLVISTGFASWQRYCTARSSGRQPNFAALIRGRHLCSAGRPSRWALAQISSWNVPLTQITWRHISQHKVINSWPIEFL